MTLQDCVVQRIYRLLIPNGLDNETAFRTVRDSAGRTGISDETGNC